MRKISLTLALLAGLSVSIAANAAEPLVLETPSATNPGLTQFEQDSLAPGQTRALSINGAKQLLASTEGKAWRVFAVQGPVCTSKKYKYCKPVKKACAEAKRFAKKYHVHATCSKLYQQSTVLLTTVPKAKKSK